MPGSKNSKNVSAEPAFTPSVEPPRVDILRKPTNRDRAIALIDAEIQRLEALAAADEAERAMAIEQGARINYDKERAKCAADIVHWWNHWVWTYDPRLVGKLDKQGKPVSPYIRMILWPRQREFLRWLEERMAKQEPWLCEKSRDVGVSYLICGFNIHKWLFLDGFKATVSSRSPELVDNIGDPDSLFHKMRIIRDRLPSWMLPDGFSKKNDLVMRMTNPQNGSIITGEEGEEMGRGGRATIYEFDEFAFVPNPDQAERAVSGSTDCIGYISTVNRPGDFFDQKRLGPGLRDDQKFIFDWHDDPRKDEAWAEAKKASLTDPTAFAREFDRDSNASVENLIIPALWVKAAQKLADLLPNAPHTGKSVAGGDVGGGKAKSVVVIREGSWVLPPQTRGQPDTTETAYWMMEIASKAGVKRLNYDSVGIGQGVLSTMSKSEKYKGLQRFGINTGMPPTSRRWDDGETSEQKFANLKAEIWWVSREYLRRSYEKLQFLEKKPGGIDHPLSDIVILPPDPTLASQLSTPLWFRNEKGKIMVEKKEQLAKRGIASPDHADAYVLAFLEDSAGVIPAIVLDATTFHRDNPVRIGG